jgi:hypothetical protein
MQIKGTLILSIALLTACSSQQRINYDYLDGINSTISKSRIAESTNNQNEVFKSLYVRAGLAENEQGSQAPIRDSLQWDDVVRAGMDYVDEQCELYMNSIFWAHRVSDTLVKNLGLVGATTSAVLGLADASSATIGYVAAAFGLSAAVVDVTASGLLYKLNPSVVRSVIENSKSAYRSAVLNKDSTHQYRNKPGAAAAIRGYLALCLPAGIEKQINNSLTNQEFTADPGETPVVKPIGAKTQQSTQILKRTEEIIERLTKVQADKRLRPTSTLSKRVNAKGKIEQSLEDEDLLKIQSALCVAEDEILGIKTRKAIDQWRISINPSLPQSTANKIEGLTLGESHYLSSSSSCIQLGYKSAFEKGFLFDVFKLPTKSGSVVNKEKFLTASHDQLLNVAIALNYTLPAGSIAPDIALRLKIKEKREALGYSNGDWLDLEFTQQLLK